MKLVKGALLAIVLSVFGAELVVAESNDTAEFSPKSVRVIVNFGVGGSTDTFARTLAPYLQKHLPSQPAVIVDNKPGADGMLGASYVFHRAQPDGRTICLCNGIVTRWATRKHMRFDIAEFAIVGSVPVNAVTLVGDDLGIQTPNDLPAHPNPLLYSAHSPIAPNSIRLRLVMEAIGLGNFRVIGGYRSTSKSLASVIRGETHIVAFSSTAYLRQKKSLLVDNAVVPIAQFGSLDSAGSVVGSATVGLPTWDAVWRELSPDTISSPEHRLFNAFYETAGVQLFIALPPETPSSIRAMWESALANAIADSEFTAARSAYDVEQLSLHSSIDTLDRLSRIRTTFQNADVRDVLYRIAPALGK